MTRILTFGYGSNMCFGRMKDRVPSLEFDAIGEIRAYRLVLNKVSKDGSAKGNVIAGEAADVTYGVVYSLDQEHRVALDKAEGAGHGYDATDGIVVHNSATGEEYENPVIIYIATRGYTAERLLPYSWYKRHIVEGALHFGLPSTYVSLLASLPAVEDPDRARDAMNRLYPCNRVLTAEEKQEIEKLERPEGQLTDYAPRLRQLQSQ